MTVAGTLHLGTSGFGYEEWKGPFYPPTVTPSQMLPLYAKRFGSVEINYTFRRDPSERTLATWRKATPDGFVFAVKAHQRITHWMRLTETDEALSAFLNRLAALRPKLGPVLFQCPPNLPFDRALIEAFVASLPPTHRYAFEFRHPSWIEAKELLASKGVAWCTAETDEQPFTAERIDATPFAYLRLRKERYRRGELRSWAARIRAVLEDGADVYCYLKHEEKGAGPILANRLSALTRDASSPRITDRSAPVRGQPSPRRRVPPGPSALSPP